MRTLSGFLILLSCLYLGQILTSIIPFPIPGIIYGFLILFILLWTKTVHLSSVDGLAEQLITLMLFMFVPGGVNIIRVLHLMEGNILPLLITVIASTGITIGVTSLTIEKVIKIQGGIDNGN